EGAVRGTGAEAFVFATRLTRVTRALREGRAERALDRAAALAPDWAGGTRLGEALRAFNDGWGRRGLARGAVVLVLSDGWERGAPSVPGAEVLEKSGDSAFKVGIKVKLGPITMQYRGDMEIVERDDSQHRAVMRVKAKEARGQGTADASATIALRDNTDGTI